MSAAEDDPRAADGRVPGRRGLATRAKLLDQTRVLLETGGYRNLKVVDIAREAGTSPATFYQYFPDVESAVLALAESTSIDTTALRDLVEAGPWTGGQAYATAEALADGFLAYWDHHATLMRVVDLATLEGDERFHQLRSRLLNQITVALADVVAAAQKTGAQPAQVDPMAQAGVLVAMLAHVSAHRPGFEQWGMATDSVRVSLARVVCWSVTGTNP